MLSIKLFRMKNIIFSSICILVLFACKKVEGEGGTSTISGTVITKDLNSEGQEQASYPGADEDVFIIYGSDETFYDDKISTSYDGSFKFRYLTPGEYTIFIYSDCSTCASGEEAVIKTVTISEKGQLVDAGEFINND